jgi:hypothetical protein
MAPLDDLKDELIARVYDHTQDLQSAASLSTANRRLHGIWRQSTEAIATRMLKSRILVYEQAVDLAVAEERLEGSSTTSASANTRPPIQHYIARLLRND